MKLELRKKEDCGTFILELLTDISEESPGIVRVIGLKCRWQGSQNYSDNVLADSIRLLGETYTIKNIIPINTGKGSEISTAKELLVFVALKKKQDE